MDTYYYKEENDDKVELKVIEGGKSTKFGKKPPGKDWLKDLKPGQSFLCIERDPRVYIEQQFHIDAVVGDYHYLLSSNLNNEYWVWVRSWNFCNNHDLCYIFPELKLD